MTTPRDDIAGLSERLWDALVDEPNYGKCLRMSLSYEDVEAAATQLDSLLKERDELKEERDQWRTQAKYETDVAHAASEEIARLNQERDALEARVKELEAQRNCYSDNLQEAYDALKQEKARALRVEQERDEAIAALKASSDWLKSSNDRWEEISKAMRRLASSPEKEKKE